MEDTFMTFNDHPAGFLKVPSNLVDLPMFRASNHMFIAPRTIDMRDYCTKTEDQGTRPMCAAYSATSMVENILWRKNDYPENINPREVYAYAKTVDGSPNVDGTTLNAALQFFITKKYFSDKSQIQMIYGADSIDKIKYAIHKFGCVHLGFNITSEWYDINKNNTSIKNKANFRSFGGHAVLGCGYNDDGLFIQNSWGENWGSYGFALITWDAVKDQFVYGAVISHCLDNFKLN